MIGGQDLGGVMGFGPIGAEAEEPVFHAEWERRVFGLRLAASALGQWNIDTERHAREARPPAEYLSSSYYELWLKGLLALLQGKGVVTAEEIAAGHPIGLPTLAGRALKADNVAATLARGGPADRPLDHPARFRVDDLVRTKLLYTTGHTRLPRYAFGKIGRVEAVRGGFVFPDSAAAGRGEAPQWLYTIRFDGRELWGEAGDEKLAVSIDAWESYLDPA
jgi:nitrile hydratase